jgi:hypothetical protein
MDFALTLLARGFQIEWHEKLVFPSPSFMQPVPLLRFGQGYAFRKLLESFLGACLNPW